MANAGAVRGGSTSAKSSYACDQNAVDHASFSAATVPYRARSQSRNAAADTSQKHCRVWQPYSLPTCHSASAGWPAYRAATCSTSRTACAR